MKNRRTRWISPLLLALFALVAAPAPLALAGSPASTIEVFVDGASAAQGTLIDGVAYVETSMLASAAGLTEGRDWHVDGTRLVVDSVTRRDADAKLQVQETGVISRKVKTIGGRAYLPTDDLARLVGGHGHLDQKRNAVRIWVGVQCPTCRIAPKVKTNSSL